MHPPAEHRPSLAIFPLLDVRVERAGHGSLRGLPREVPDDSHADRGPVNVGEGWHGRQHFFSRIWSHATARMDS